LVDGKAVVESHGMRHFGTSVAQFPWTHTKVYIAITALLINVIVAVVVTLILRVVRTPEGVDATEPEDYYTDAPSPAVLSEADREFSGAEETAPR